MSLRSGCLLLLLVFALCGGLFTWWVRDALQSPYYSGAESETFVEVPKGAGTARIASILAENGILREPLPFSLYVRWIDSGTQLQAGEYRVLPARAWQFYFPDVQGNSAGAVFEIKP